MRLTATCTPEWFSKLVRLQDLQLLSFYKSFNIGGSVNVIKMCSQCAVKDHISGEQGVDALFRHTHAHAVNCCILFPQAASHEVSAAVQG